MKAFLGALFLIAAAELADKTQLLALAFAARLPLRHVLVGVLIGVFVTQTLAVVLGRAALLMIPVAWVKVAGGLSFLVFGAWMLRGARPVAGEVRELGHPLVTVAVSFFLAEMGDKTQLATAVLAAQAGAPVHVWIGSALGMLLANAVAVMAGVLLGRRLPVRTIEVGASGLFVAFGLLLLWDGLSAIAPSWR